MDTSEDKTESKLPAPQCEKKRGSLLDWLREHSAAIQAVAAIVSAIIAAAMLWSLNLNKQQLELTQRQLETTINPVFAVWLNGPDAIIANEGSTDISNVEMAAVLAGFTDKNMEKLDSYQIVPAKRRLFDRLRPNETKLVKLKDFAFPVGQEHKVGEGGTFYTFVFKYRRSVDMKPFAKFFFALGGPSIPVFMPLRACRGSSVAVSERSFLFTKLKQDMRNHCLDELDLDSASIEQ